MTETTNRQRQIGSDAAGVIAQVRDDGTLQSLRVRYPDGWHTIEFRTDQYAGPAFKGVALRATKDDQPTLTGEQEGVRYGLEYRAEAGGLDIIATVENTTRQVFAPAAVSLEVGIDTYMDRFPRWNTQFFPTFLRCEQTHFWGYLMTPKSRILGVSSPDPVASYTIEYKQTLYAHYIYTFALDLLHQAPLPSHHPSLHVLEPGERRVWRICLDGLRTLPRLNLLWQDAAPRR